MHPLFFMELILASKSPQRANLLKGIGVKFTVDPSLIDESSYSEKDPLKRSIILAHEKALERSGYHPEKWILGGDSLVVAADGSLFEKPENATQARQMLKKHSGNTSIVHSALCLLSPDKKIFEDVSTSLVTFKKLSDEDIEWWISTNHWKDRAGAFQLEGEGQLIIERIEGDWTGIVGLPVFLFGELCRQAGVVLKNWK